MVYVLPFLSYLAGSKSVSVRLRYDDKYHSRSYCFVEWQKLKQIHHHTGDQADLTTAHIVLDLRYHFGLWQKIVHGITSQPKMCSIDVFVDPQPV